MNDRLEQNLRDAFSYRDAQLDSDAIARLRATDYRPRRRSRRLPAIGALGAAGLAAIAGTILALGTGAAPAFAGWQATPTTPDASQVAQVEASCSHGTGTPTITDSRGPYTASIDADSSGSSFCLADNGNVLMESQMSGNGPTLAPDQVQLSGAGVLNNAVSGASVTIADGEAGSAVTGVTIELSDGTSVQATVGNGWYLAWWPNAVKAASAVITTASGTTTVNYPASPALTCPSGADNCTVGYGFGGGGHGSSSMSMQSGGAGGSVTSSSVTSGQSGSN